MVRGLDWVSTLVRKMCRQLPPGLTEDYCSTLVGASPVTYPIRTNKSLVFRDYHFVKLPRKGCRGWIQILQKSITLPYEHFQTQLDKSVLCCCLFLIVTRDSFWLQQQWSCVAKRTAVHCCWVVEHFDRGHFARLTIISSAVLEIVVTYHQPAPISAMFAESCFLTSVAGVVILSFWGFQWSVTPARMISSDVIKSVKGWSILNMGIKIKIIFDQDSRRVLLRKKSAFLYSMSLGMKHRLYLMTYDLDEKPSFSETQKTKQLPYYTPTSVRNATTTNSVLLFKCALVWITKN